MVKCAVQGLSHVASGTVCQDKVFNLTEGDVSAIALADGAGSARFSHFGAEVVTQFICRKLCQDFNSIFDCENPIEISNHLIDEIKEQLNQLSKEKGCEINDLASTLLFVAVKENRYILGQIGDGILGYLQGGDLKAKLMPAKEGAVNETFFTTSIYAKEQMQLSKGELNTTNAFVLMSDGSEMSLYDKRAHRLAPVLKEIMIKCETHQSEILEKMLTEDFERVVRHRTQDDCSLIFMYNVKEEKIKNLKNFQDAQIGEFETEILSLIKEKERTVNELLSENWWREKRETLTQCPRKNEIDDVLFNRCLHERKIRKEQCLVSLNRLQEKRLIYQSGHHYHLFY